MENLFKGLFDSQTTHVISPGTFLLCLGVSLLLGLAMAGIYAFRNKTSRSFLCMLSLLPATVCVVIMMVNGNVGIGVAVAGAFSLVRFRSAPGSAREMVAIFSAMAAGLVAGTGYLAYAVLFTLIIGGFMLILSLFFGGEKADRVLTVTIPEDLNDLRLIDDLLDGYTVSHRMLSVKTAGLGSLYKLKYEVRLKDAAKEKEFMDAIRCRNGNLEVALYEKEENVYEL